MVQWHAREPRADRERCALTNYDLNWMISVDDHVLEPPHVWETYLPARFRDQAPKMIKIPNGEAWEFAGKVMPTSGLSAVAGKDKEEFSPLPVSYSDMRPGCYDSVARLEDMNTDGVAASMCFPSFPRFCGQTFYEADDKELGFACVQAYNNWMIEEWCGAAPGRYIPLVLIPLWDPALAATEIERCAALGARAVAFSENPAPLGLPTINDPSGYWDPMLAAAAANELVVCMHVGSSSQLPEISPNSPFLANLSWGAVRTAGTMLEWLFSGVFQRMPELKIALSEGNIGWIPYFLERAEQVLDTQRHWVSRGIDLRVNADAAVSEGNVVAVDLNTLDVRETYRNHIFGCFIDDESGIRNLDLIGKENVMIETDYPHSDSPWPNSMKRAKELLAALPEETQYKILRGNAERLFRFEAAVPAAV